MVTFFAIMTVLSFGGSIFLIPHIKDETKPAAGIMWAGLLSLTVISAIIVLITY